MTKGYGPTVQSVIDLFEETQPGHRIDENLHRPAVEKTLRSQDAI